MGIADKISKFNRKRKWGQFTKNVYFDQNTRILDVGFNDIEYSDVDNFLEKNYQYKHNITAIGIEWKDHFSRKYPLVNSVLYDGDTFPFNRA